MVTPPMTANPKEPGGREELREKIARIVGEFEKYLRGNGLMTVAETADLIFALLPDPDEVSFQPRVEPWMRECFGDVIPFDKVERGDRLLEEVFELLQSGGYDPGRVTALRDYVWGRPVGESAQEVGGVMVTLAAYCLAFGLDMHQAGETELARIWTKVEAIRAKQASKPVGSALPIVVPPDEVSALRARVEEWQSIESVPRDGTVVLVWLNTPSTFRGSVVVPAFWCDEEDGLVTAHPFHKRIWVGTHWMPLPAPPAAALLSRSPK